MTRISNKACDCHEAFMGAAIRLAAAAVRKNRGGPFGAVIVRDGRIIASGGNKVTSSKDPTAHAEIVAIRRACKRLRSFSLKGCEIYCSCEPCPMCLAAIYWARIDRVYFAGKRSDAAQCGFDDDAIYREIPLPNRRRKLPMVPLMRGESLIVFGRWRRKPDKILY